MGYLLDLKTNEIIDLKFQNTYDFYHIGESKRFKLVNEIPVSDDEVIYDEIKFGPNPSNGELNIQYEGDVIITNIYGQIVYFKYIDGSEILNLDLPSGVYFLNNHKFQILK